MKQFTANGHASTPFAAPRFLRLSGKWNALCAVLVVVSCWPFFNPSGGEREK